MAINDGAFTQDFRTQLRKYSDGATRVGEEGRLWYNNADQTIRVSDGSTAGGVVINAGGGSSGVTVQEEGSALSTAGTTLNFVGSSVTASGTGATKTITIVDSSLTVQDEGGSLSTTATTLNFVGSGVVASGTGSTKTITISGGGGSSGVTVQEEGSSLSTAGTTLNFVGSGVTASGSGATKTITVSASAITVQDEGSSLSTSATTLNFVGSGVVASGTGSTKTITIGGGSGGDVVDDTSPQLGGNLDINGFNITSGRSNENINVVPNGTGKLVVAGDLLPEANITYNLGSANFRWKDLYLSGDTINLGSSTISGDGTGTITISADGVTLPDKSKTESNRELATFSADNTTNQVVVLVPFFSAAGGLVTKNAEFEFNGNIDDVPVFTGSGTFTLANGDAFTSTGIVLFQL